MSCKISIVYPHRPNSTFDLSYYLSTHMPLVQRLWQPVGLRKWEVHQLNKDSGYSIQAILSWDSVEEWEKATVGPQAAEVFGDIPNFSNEQPIQLKGTLVGKQEGAA